MAPEPDAFYPGYPDDRDRPGDVTIELDAGALETKLAAMKSHRSRIGALETLLGPSDYARLAGVESYRPANDEAWALLSPAVASRSA